METAQRHWIGRNEALDRLGVKTQTLYAYVSRGRITARPDPENPRRSLYAADDVARLCDGTPAPAAPAVIGASAVRGEATVQSSVTAIIGGRLFYRGRDAVQLAEHATLEDAARVLWNARDANPFAPLKPRIDVAYAGPSRSRLLQFIARRVDEDPPAADRTAHDLTVECAGVLSEMVDAIVGMGPRLHLHQRLARAWKISERDSGILRRALVLSADHELNGAVLAARAVAGTGASPAAAAMAGLAALTGPDVSRQLSAASALVLDARRDPAETVRRRMDEDGRLPGFGHELYPDGDPRAAALLAAADLPRDLAALVEAGERATGLKPSFDLALALIVRRFNLPRDGAFDLFAIGRTAGLLAHALDQLLEGSPIRARLRYVGVEPGAH